MKKIAIFLLTAAIAGVCLTACGNDGGTEPTRGAASTVTSSGTGSKAKDEIEHIDLQGSGVAWDDGKNFFAIDSMTMTDEGLVIRYRGEVDPDVKTNQKGNFEADYKRFELNGKPLSTVRSRSLEGAEHEFQVKQSAFYVDGRDVVNEIVIPADQLQELEITSTPTLDMDIWLGYDEAGWGLRKSVRFTVTVTP